MLYLAYGHGTKTGGYVETNTNAYPVFADPAVDSRIKSEVAQTVEAGIKSTLFNHSLRINASIFHTVITNFQDTLFTGAAAGFITENLPARTKGFEIETAWQVNRELAARRSRYLCLRDGDQNCRGCGVGSDHHLSRVSRHAVTHLERNGGRGLPAANHGLPQPGGRGTLSLSRIDV